MGIQFHLSLKKVQMPRSFLCFGHFAICATFRASAKQTGISYRNNGKSHGISHTQKGSEILLLFYFSILHKKMQVFFCKITEIFLRFPEEGEELGKVLAFFHNSVLFTIPDGQHNLNSGKC